MEKSEKGLTEEENLENWKKLFYQEILIIFKLSQMAHDEKGYRLLQEKLKTIKMMQEIVFANSEQKSNKNQPKWKNIKTWVKKVAPWLFPLFSNFCNQ